MLEANQILKNLYQLKEKLSQNAGRQTWLAEDISIQPAEVVIIKFLSFGENFQWQDLKLFEREADILKQLSHPKIPKYRDYFSIEDNNNWFALVEEYIPGESLKQLFEAKKRFTEQELKKIGSEVLDILCYLHTLNPQVIHRDIKPSNLIIGVDKKVYLIDFGAVQDSVAAQGATFTVVGTYGYAPIEQFGGRTVPASDLYALGATLIHLATGTIPADLPQTKMRIQFRDKVSLSDGFISWIEKLTEPDIDDRFTTADEALKALNSPLVSNSSTAEIVPSKSNRIKLDKSNDKLEIIVDGYTEDRFFLFITFLIISITIFPLVPIGFLVSIFLLFFCFLLFTSIYKTFYLRFNPQKFVVESKSKSKYFNCLNSWKLGDTSEIKSVRKDYLQSRQGKTPIIRIETASKKYEIIEGLNEAEIDWLVKEIKDWLYNL
ncbi:serine/threonine protein kinase [Calothrix parasitica NIES-267]|uniref:Serine/threonine protein kinase n=1 Tax=Calothrix parasitica NIES-267 TaxID=1973488 RepID=A0A1Z4LMU0_9CYAN|nr:serine/threonine protein kinase [Calothrix parasitica NIES-267]